MSDIVERLRAVYAAGPIIGSFLDPVPDPLCSEAAAEIERLNDLVNQYGNEITGKLMPENDRLRDLLRRWADHLSNDWEIELASDVGDSLLRETLEALVDVSEPD